MKSLAARWETAQKIRLELKRCIDERRKLLDAQKVNSKRLKELTPLIENLQSQLLEELG